MHASHATREVVYCVHTCVRFLCCVPVLVCCNDRRRLELAESHVAGCYSGQRPFLPRLERSIPKSDSLRPLRRSARIAASFEMTGTAFLLSSVFGSVSWPFQMDRETWISPLR